MAGSTKLLIVDDEESLRTLMKHELGACGFTVQEADNGLTALELIEQNSFDLVILDIRMPEMDGLTVLRTIKEKNFPVKVIMLTGVDELKIARECLASGANDFMTKPFDFKSLIACINRVMKE